MWLKLQPGHAFHVNPLDPVPHEVLECCGDQAIMRTENLMGAMAIADSRRCAQDGGNRDVAPHQQQAGGR